MAVFTPPLNANEVPSISLDPRTPTFVNRCMGHFSGGSRGRNVYIYSDNTVSEVDPDSISTFWDKQDGTPYISHAFWGSHTGETVTTAEATLLTNAGYIVT